MAKRKGSSKVKDSSHSRKQSRDHVGSASSTQPLQHQHLHTTTARNTHKKDDQSGGRGGVESQQQQVQSPSPASGAAGKNHNFWFMTFRLLNVFVTKYLLYIVLAYLALAVTVLVWEMSHGKIRIEITPVRLRHPSALLRQFRTTVWDTIFFRHQNYQRYFYSRTRNNEMFIEDPAQRAIIFAVLREAIVREPGGYVHPDLGILQPAPSGAVRGIGMVKDAFHQCQAECFPGTSQPTAQRIPNSTRYKQQDILIRVPLSYQMNRQVAIETIVPLLPSAEKAAGMADLDDPTLLVLLLAHERSKKRYSRWYPYIASLPPQPSCGYWRESRTVMLQALAQYRARYQMDADGWEDELYKATEYSETIVRQLAADYGPFIFKDTKDSTRMYRRMAWALCQVASRATAGNSDHGTVRLIPLLDMINHDLQAGGFLELTGKETIAKGDPLDASMDDEGTFIVRSLRHGRRKPLKVGQELLVNYNVPNYTPLDWFISVGFVPPERRTPWIKIDPVLPPLRNDNSPHHGTQDSIPTEQSIRNKEKFIETKLKAFMMSSNAG